MRANRMCPEDEQLESFVTGRLEEEITESLIKHLGTCPQCTGRLRVLSVHDSLLSALSQPPAPLASDEHARVEQLISKLCQQAKQSGDTEAAAGATGGETQFAQAVPTVLNVSHNELHQLLAPPQHADEIGRLGEFSVRGVLGSGGMGMVLAAVDSQLGRTVALKVMRPSLSSRENASERFLREARSMAAVADDHIVPIYQVGEAAGVPYFVMPVLDGQSLDKRLQCGRRLPLRQILALGIETALALSAAHERGLIHRDIKPSNIWLEPVRDATSDDAADDMSADENSADDRSAVEPLFRVKVLDFGLARAADDSLELTQTGCVAGTPWYMSPEQARGEPLDARSDLFSLGCVLYEAATGQRPFDGKNQTAAILALTTEPPRRVLELNRALPPALALLIENLLEKSPHRRCQSAKEVVRQLRGIQRQVIPPAAGVHANRHQPLRRRWWRRHPAWPVLGLLSMLLVAVAAIAMMRVEVPVAEGTLIVELADPNMEGAAIRVDENNQVTVQPGQVGQEIRIAAQPGTHRLRITKDGFEALTREIEIRAGKSVTVQARLLPKADPVSPPVPASRQASSNADPPQQGPASLPALGVAPYLSEIPGLIPQPATVPGIKRWQLCTVAPRGEILAVAWSPDGQRLACGTALGHVRVYDASLRQLVGFAAAHKGRVRSLSWSTHENLLVSGGEDGKICLWDPHTMQSPRVLEGHQGPVLALSLHPNDKILASGGDDRSVRLWDLSQRATTAKVLNQHTSLVVALDWNASGERLASADAYGGAVIWSLSGDLMHRLSSPGERTWATLDWSPDGKLLALAGREGRIEIWNAAGQRQEVVKNGESWIHAISWSAGGELAASNESGELVVFNQRFERVAELPTHRGRVHCLTWHPEGTSLVSGSGSGVLQLCNQKLEVLQQIESPTKPLHAVDWSSAGLFATGESGTVWGLSDTGEVRHVLQGHGRNIVSISASPDGRYVVSGGWDGRVFIWNLADKSSQSILGTNPVAWHPRDEKFAYSVNGGVRVWTPDSDVALCQPPGVVSSVAWTPDGTALTTGDFDGVLRHWDSSGRQLATGRSSPLVFGLDWHPSQPLLASSCAGDNDIHVWDAALTELRRQSGHGSNITSVHWDADGERLLSGSGDGTVRIWDRGGVLQHTFGTDMTTVTSVCFSPDGKQLAATRTDGSLIVSDASTGRTEFLFVPFGHDRPLVLRGDGQVIDGKPNQLDRDLIVIVESSAGDVRKMTTAEFWSQ